MCPRLNSVVSMPPGRVVWGSMLGVLSRVFTVKSQNMLCPPLGVEVPQME